VEENKKNNEATIQQTTSVISAANRWDHFLARVGVKRMRHLVEPGLYSIGNPTPESPVLVSANYTLSFDALRSHLANFDGYILVLDTKGVNVWCAAGEGTFGTDELVHRIETTNLKDMVTHRSLILPQLGAPGVAAHEVKKRSGFKVEYGPVRAADLPQYLKTGLATPEMRQVRFTLPDRLELIPVELVGLSPVILILALLRSYGLVAAVLAGVILFPILLPWIPTKNFCTKGFILGGLTALPFAISALTRHPDASPWLRAGWALDYFLLMPSITAYITLNFTGSTTFTSRSGVRREIFTYVPAIAGMFVVGLILNIAFIFIR